MLPGRDECYSGWITEYSGYLAAQRYNQYRTEFVCVDGHAQRSGSVSNQNGVLFNPAQTKCGSLPCDTHSRPGGWGYRPLIYTPLTWYSPCLQYTLAQRPESPLCDTHSTAMYVYRTTLVQSLITAMWRQPTHSPDLPHSYGSLPSPALKKNYIHPTRSQPPWANRPQEIQELPSKTLSVTQTYSPLIKTP